MEMGGNQYECKSGLLLQRLMQTEQVAKNLTFAPKCDIIYVAWCKNGSLHRAFKRVFHCRSRKKCGEFNWSWIFRRQKRTRYSIWVEAKDCLRQILIISSLTSKFPRQRQDWSQPTENFWNRSLMNINWIMRSDKKMMIFWITHILRIHYTFDEKKAIFWGFFCRAKDKKRSILRVYYSLVCWITSQKWLNLWNLRLFEGLNMVFL